MYQRGIRTGDPNPAAHNNLGNLLRKLGRGQEAIPYFRRAIEVDPRHAEAYNNLGAVLADAGKWDEAATNYQAALNLRPGFAEAHNNLGVALVRLGRAEEAIGHFEAALRSKAQYPEAENGLGLALATAGRVDEARTLMHSLIPHTLRINESVDLMNFAEDYAAILADLGEPVPAVRLLGAADAARERFLAPRDLLQQAELADPIAKTRDALPAGEWDAAYQGGRRTSVEDALGELLSPAPAG
jgi:tetratricopeptide (TPR) repeat protein